MQVQQNKTNYPGSVASCDRKQGLFYNGPQAHTERIKTWN